MQKKLISPIKLFLFFVKIGCFTFGGGWSILTQMEQEFVDKQKLITKEELLDITSVGRSMPGIMITNITMIFGYRVAGILGGIASVIGVVVPSIVILSIVTFLYNEIVDNPYVEKLLMGIRSAVVPIIAGSAISLGKTALKDKLCVITCLAAFGLSLFADIGNIQIVLTGIVCAFIIGGIKRRGTA